MDHIENSGTCYTRNQRVQRGINYMFRVKVQMSAQKPDEEHRTEKAQYQHKPIAFNRNMQKRQFK